MEYLVAVDIIVVIKFDVDIVRRELEDELGVTMMMVGMESVVKLGVRIGEV